jgi:hypothetical protein
MKSAQWRDHDRVLSRPTPGDFLDRLLATDTDRVASGSRVVIYVQRPGSAIGIELERRRSAKKKMRQNENRIGDGAARPSRRHSSRPGNLVRRRGPKPDRSSGSRAHRCTLSGVACRRRSSSRTGSLGRGVSGCYHRPESARFWSATTLRRERSTISPTGGRTPFVTTGKGAPPPFPALGRGRIEGRTATVDPASGSAISCRPTCRADVRTYGRADARTVTPQDRKLHCLVGLPPVHVE